MAVTRAVAELLSLPEPSARFLVALFSAYLVSLLYKAVCARQRAVLQNAFFALSGLWIMYFVYGHLLWHSLLDVAVVYALLWLFGGTRFGVLLTWIFTLSHLLLGYYEMIVSNEVHSISWTIPHSVLVLKLIALSYNLYDATKKEEEVTDDIKETALPNMPSVLEVMGFAYFCGSVLAGPQISFTRYHKFVNRRLFDVDNTPSSISAGFQRLFLGVFFSVLYSASNQFYPVSYLVSEGFATEPLVRKLWLVFITGKVALWRYVTVWLFAEGACIVSGITYTLGEKGKVEWNALANIHIIKNETCITLQGVIDSFNVNTNQWLAFYVFKRLKWLGSKAISHMCTLIFVSVWHGLWPGYMFCFTFEFIAIMAERNFILMCKRLLGCDLQDLHAFARVPLMLVAYVAKNVILMYALIFFQLLTWKMCWKFMSSVYLYGHVTVLCWILIHYFLFQRRRSWRAHSKQE